MLKCFTNYGDDDDTPYGPRLSSFYLHTPEWREAFLERLVEVGEVALIEATARVYDLLEEPKATRCALIAESAKVSGMGKLAILNALKAYLEEWLQAPPVLPSASRQRSLEAWRATAINTWASEQKRERAVVRKFAAILNGSAPSGR